MSVKGFPALDRFRLLAAVLVVAIHTSPLASVSQAGDFLLTRLLARVAVPFFLMVSGHFLFRRGRRGMASFLKKTLLLYAVSILLYLPLNIYAGQINVDFLRRLFTDGTFYHLWYFPGLMLGIPIAYALKRLGAKAALLMAVLLYLIGLCGDSYYGFVSQVPALKEGYGLIFHIFTYTRNGLFYMPLFLLLGWIGHQFPKGVSIAGLLLSMAAMAGEAICLHRAGIPRHDSMYLLLPLVMVFLFSLLLNINKGEDKNAREISSLMYLLHPWCIVLVRFVSSLTGLERLFIHNSLCHFASVLSLTLLASGLLRSVRPRPVRTTARAWQELDMKALSHNVSAIRALLSPMQEIMAVVKDDAYGHGAVKVCRHLRKCGVRTFAVACVSEGIALRRAGIRGNILVLGYTMPEEAPSLRRYRLTQAVVDLNHGIALDACSIPIRVHLAIDTGMHRLGIPVGDRAAIQRLFELKRLKITGLFTHLCVADSLDERDQDYTSRQMEAFYSTVEYLRSAGFDPGAIHAQSSYGILNLPPQPCSYARPGLLLYGVLDLSATTTQIDLRPVLSIRARVAQVRRVPAGERAGYGLDFESSSDTTLAVVTIGYGDGLPRELPQRGGQALLHGRLCPMVGRMCMDQLFLDVTHIPEASPGDVVTIIGSDGCQTISAQDIAQQCGTIVNELFSQLKVRMGA